MKTENVDQARAFGRMNWLDIVRGVALFAMAHYHFMWDLSMFGYLEPGYAASGWPKVYARTIASTFLFLAGFSLYLSHGSGIKWPKFWKRWRIVAGAALLVTVVSYFAIPQGLIHFGILHQIAATSLIGLLFLRAPIFVILSVALAVFVAPFYLESDAFNEPWLWWVGLSTEPRLSFDYVPMLPWLSVGLVGIVAGRMATARGWLRQNESGDKRPGRLGSGLAFFGRHSLVFYLVHQPILISIVYVFSLVYPAAGRPDEFVQSCVQSCLPGADEASCRRYCDCALTGLQAEELLGPLQSGTMPEAYRGTIDKIRSQCTSQAFEPLDATGN